MNDIIKRINAWLEIPSVQPSGNGRANPDNDFFFLLADASEEITSLMFQATVAKKFEEATKEKVKELAARIEKLEKQLEWMPIEGAPKDGTKLLMAYPAEDGEKEFIEINCWVEVPHELNADSWTVGGVDPTHYQLLPPPPKE